MLCGVSMCALLWTGAVGYRELTFVQLERQGRAIFDEVESYHRMHSEYPVSAAAAGIELPVTRFGQWQYEIVEIGYRVVDGQIVATPGRRSFRLKLSTKHLPRAVLRPFFTLSWTEWGGWRLSTDPC